jgi:DNA topoisomerase-3
VSKTLIIAEKPSVAADIARVVGAETKNTYAWESDSHIVSWALGHLVEFLEPEGYDKDLKRWRLKDLPIAPEAFQVQPVRGARKQLTALKKFLNNKEVDHVINACDAGREGELIFREIYRFAGSKKPVQRLWLQSMTTNAIRESLKNPRDNAEVDGLADAADCRAESDWLIGINATRALTIRMRSSRDRGVWSAGRVQTATLAILVRRELEILAHTPAAYWTIAATFGADGPPSHQYEANWFNPKGEAPRDRIHATEERDRVLALLESGPDATATETRKDSRATAPPLFDLTTLQREANRRFGFAARRTLRAAQQLYETEKALTYPRTDSKALPSDYGDIVTDVIQTLSQTKPWSTHAKTLLNQDLENTERIFNDAAISDHFAIIPTGQGDLTKLDGDAARIFDLVTRRFLAAFHPPAISTEIERITLVSGDSFRTRLKVLKEPGWRAVHDKDSEDSDVALPPLNATPTDTPTAVTLAEHSHEEKETKPLARHNEAALLGLMETAGKEIDDSHYAQVMKDTGGLGTPATRADIIETLLSREYAERCASKDGRRGMRATPRGIRLIEALNRINLPRLTSPELTASLEDALQAVEKGERMRDEYMSEIRSWTNEIVEAIRGFEYDTLYADTADLGDCPACKDGKVRESMRTYSCSNGGKEGTCAFVIWKEAGGRFIDRETAKTLLDNRETASKVGFFTRDAREYEATIGLLEDHRMEIRSKGQEIDTDNLDISPVDVGKCPQCGDGIIRRGPRGFTCIVDDAKGCGFSLPLQLCKRTLEPAEVEVLIGDNRKTETLEGFTSRRNRPFSAMLKLEESGKIAWEFPPRSGADGAGQARKFEVNSEPVGPCDCKNEKSGVMENETEFRCTADDCRRGVPREICKREITRDEVKSMFNGKESELLEGFISKAGKPFSAKLYFKKNGRHGFRFPEK